MLALALLIEARRPLLALNLLRVLMLGRMGEDFKVLTAKGEAERLRKDFGSEAEESASLPADPHVEFAFPAIPPAR